jgi:uncharacterized membrane protein
MHNNYLTLPVVFVMIANHLPQAFASAWNWLILSLVLVVGALIRHFFNSWHKEEPAPWWAWAAAAMGVVAIVWLSTDPAISAKEAAAAPDAALAQEIVLSRCSMCHAAEPLWPGLHAAPKGVLLDSPARMQVQARQIWLNAVHTRAMPPGNLTELSDDDRRVLAAWIAAGAPLE